MEVELALRFHTHLPVGQPPLVLDVPPCWGWQGGEEVLWSVVGPLGKGTGAHSCPFQVCLRLQYLPGSSPRRSLLGTHGSSCGMWQGGPLSQDQ